MTQYICRLILWSHQTGWPRGESRVQPSGRIWEAMNLVRVRCQQVVVDRSENESNQPYVIFVLKFEMRPWIHM